MTTDWTGDDGDVGNEEIWEWAIMEQANGWWSTENSVGKLLAI